MIPEKVKKAVLTRDGGVCVLASFGCTRVATVADHRVGRGIGGGRGLDVPVNLVAACVLCNGLKEDDTQFQRECARRGLKIRRTQTTTQDLENAARIPVQYPDGTWWILTGTTKHPPPADQAEKLTTLITRHGLDHDGRKAS